MGLLTTVNNLNDLDQCVIIGIIPYFPLLEMASGQYDQYKYDQYILT